MATISMNGIIEINRGDTITLPVYIDDGDGYTLQLHKMLDGDYLYFAIMEPNQRWEDAIVRKTFTKDDISPYRPCVNVHIYSEDTEYLQPGTYYYQVKLRIDHTNTADGFESVETIIPKTKFIIVE